MKSQQCNVVTPHPSHPVTYDQMVAQETLRHHTRLADLDEAADWIRKIEGDLSKLVQLGCLYSTGAHSMHLELRGEVEEHEGIGWHGVLRITPAFIGGGSESLITSFISIGWVIESANTFPEIGGGTAILWKPGTNVRVAIGAASEFLKPYTKAATCRAPATAAQPPFPTSRTTD